MVEREKLCRLAEVVFRDHGELHITGQGTLKRAFLSAHLADDSRKIYPPEEHYFFHKNGHTTTDGNLLEKVGIYFILDEREAADYVHRWEQELMRESAVGPVKFGDFGYFRYGNSLEFEAAGMLYYEWLPVLDYAKAAGKIRDLPGKGLIKQAFETQETPALHALPPRTKKRPVVMYAMWSLLLLLFVFAFSFWMPPLQALFDSGPELNRKLVNVAPEFYDYPEDLDRYSDTEMTAENLIPDREKEQIVEKGMHSDDPENRKKEENHSAEMTELIPVESDAADESALCTLVVGGFAESGNVSRMIQALEAMELKTVTMQGKTITLVGAKVDCKDQSRIDDIKNKIEPDAWIYHK